ncbi:hypothetical protein CEQ21_23855 [Niallia circulans]|uniref:Uncharacterized protein n=1 Tax=Niallia circulans TaxID=1397 RepID=A0A553SN60_NIACI|nr:hypothetical protein [Niallia circulans]TRZ38429.1 hypothetical protein CEQ21_23855 [Niallia circulans]
MMTNDDWLLRKYESKDILNGLSNTNAKSINSGLAFIEDSSMSKMHAKWREQLLEGIKKTYEDGIAYKDNKFFRYHVLKAYFFG